jgi:hypothetical protein
MSYSQTKLGELERIAANADRRRIGPVLELYGKYFGMHSINLRDTPRQSMSSCTLWVTSRRSYPRGKSGIFLKLWKRIVMGGHH